MGYLNRPEPRGTGNRGSFGMGMNNPQFGAASTVRRPTGRATTTGVGGYGGTATSSSTSGLAPRGTGRWDDFKKSRGTTTYSGSRRDGVISSGGKIRRGARDAYDFQEADIPDERIWEGEKWAPSQTYEGSVTDTSELIAATDALLRERMGGEMSEAARRFGQIGALQSGGGLGGGYVGTLGESERGYRRDYGEMAHRYRFQAEQADAERQARALEGAMNRESSSHEGYENRRFGAHGMGADYDKWRYGAQTGAAGRSQADAIRDMMSLYGG